MDGTPYQIQPVPCFDFARLRLTQTGDEFTARLLLELQWRPLSLSFGELCLYREYRVVFSDPPGIPGIYALVFDMPYDFVVRPVLVADNVKDRDAFLRSLPGLVIAATTEAIYAQRT